MFCGYLLYVAKCCFGLKFRKCETCIFLMVVANLIIFGNSRVDEQMIEVDNGQKQVDKMMRVVDKLAIAIVCLILTGTGLRAETPPSQNWSSEHISIGDGLPFTNVDGLFRDDKGFIWIGMFGGGLSRYDGHSFVNFSSKPDRQRPDRACLSSDMVTESCQDRFDRMWVSHVEGLDLIDMKTHRSIPLPEPVASSVKGQYCSYLTLDADGSLWYSISNHIYRLSFDRDGSLASVDSLRCAEPLSELRLNMKDVDGDGSVWTSIGGSLYKIFPVADNGLDIKPLFPAVHLGPGNKVVDFQRQGNDIWIGTTDGLYRLGSNDGRVTIYRHSEDDPTSLCNDAVTGLALTSDGDLFVATLNGVSLYDPVTASFITFNSSVDRYGNKMLAGDMVRSIAATGNVVWVGTEQDGINILRKKRLPVSNAGHRENDYSSLPGTPVSALHIDSRGRLWAGSLENGLFVHRGELRFDHYSSHNSALPQNSVISMESDSSSQVWLGTMDGHICIASEDNPGSITIPPGSDSDIARKIQNVNDLAYDDRNGCMWICSRNGLFRYIIAEGRFEEFGEHLSLCVSARKDRFGRLWIGHRTGVSVIDLETMAYSCCQDVEMAFFLDFDESDRLWVGTFDRGLYRSSSAISSGEDLSLERVEGMAEERIRSVIAGDGQLWVGTEDGLVRINAVTGVMDTFNVEDGLASSSFYDNSVIGTSDGYILFGQKTGISIIWSNYVRPVRDERSKVSIINCLTSDGYDEQVYTRGVRIHEKDGTFGFTFTDFNMDRTGGTRYSCRIEPGDRKWREIDEGVWTVRYGKISRGKHLLKLRAQDQSGNVIGEDAVEIRVVPRFWKTWWFALLVLALGVFAVAVIIRARTRYLLRNRAALEEKLEKQRLALTQQKQLLLERTEALSEQNRRLMKQNEQMAGMQMAISRAAVSEQEKKDAGFVDKLMDSVRELYKNPDLEVNDLAEHMGMSRSVLNSRIQECFGKSIGQFIRAYRLNVAKEMISSGQSGDMNVSEIAYEVGFNDPKYFTRCFTREFSVAPSIMMNGGKPSDEGDASIMPEDTEEPA